MNSDFDVPYIKIDQKKFLDPFVPHFAGVGKFYFDQKLVTRSSFRGHNFLSILSTSSKFSTGHAFHLFKLIFSMVTSFVLLSEEKMSKNKIK